MAAKPSSKRIFARYEKKGRGTSLKKQVTKGTITNIDYSNYKSYRADIKACARLYFPKLFVKKDGKRKCILKNVLSATFKKIKDRDSKIKELDFKHNLKKSKELRVSDTAETVKSFLDSVLNYEFQGVISSNIKSKKKNAQEPTVSSIPAYHTCRTDINAKYCNNYRMATKMELEKVYRNEIGRSVDLNCFSCPFSQSIVDRNHSSYPEVDHILPKTQIHEKLLASVYLLNKLRPDDVDQKKDYDEYLKSINKFYVLNLKFRRYKSTTSSTKISKELIFATKNLAVQVQNDTRNLMFMCKACNIRRKKGGWKDELVKSRSFGPIDDLINSIWKNADVSGTLILKEAAAFRMEVVQKYTITYEKEEDFKEFVKYLGDLLRKYPKSVKEISKLAKNTCIAAQI
ncbi:uncharacterized protein TRIADDRAFT_62631 [Trichoplax adhaerens]|uniref:Uncharacterized protein n=1 Tax=Trichoplax adhaerens TaxID=10228 RepID=B3SEE0_TRIAD|nr:predicted protein [Trichoplax adhaerens]EDV18905.1 predicted protein [Trichoplax adhaerens]|eukprot:XP_002118608.1 predicted protein [Trichoplax adhaerens]